MRLRNLFSRSDAETDLDQELHFYLDQLAEEKRRSGMNDGEALRSARIEFGGMEQVKEEIRQARSGQLLEGILRDLRFGFRTLRRKPAFTILAVLVLALGIGANTAMFSVVYGMLFRPLPYAGADRVAVVYMNYSPRDFTFGTMCIRDYLTWKANNHSFEEPSLFRTLSMDIGGTAGVPEQVQGASVPAGFFSTLGVTPLIGRTFATDEDKPASGAFVVIGESIWRRRFASNSAVLGQAILVNGAPATVIGVMPGAIGFPNRGTEVWTNLPLNPPTRYGPWFYRGVARLKPGVTLQQAQVEVNSIGQLMMRQNPYYKRVTLPLLGLREALLGTALKPAILVLAGAVGMVLLIAVVNVANLMLARATVQEREMALRLSLGAGPGRLIRQLLTESILVAAMGGVAGLALAGLAIGLIHAGNPGNLPMVDSVRLDWNAFGFMLIVSLATGILFGLAPALQSARLDLNSSIKERGGNGAANRSRGRAALVVCEIAVSLMLLVGAGLLLRSFSNLQHTDAGFSAPPRHVLTMLISPGNKKYSDAHAGIPFYDDVLRTARSLPGVDSAAVTDSLPPDRQGDADTFVMEGQTLAPGDLNPVVSDATVSPDFFRALGIPLIAGRYFTDRDTQDSPLVTIVSEGFAHRFFPGRQVLGKRIKQSGPEMGNAWMEIVGVVGNVKYLGFTVDTDPAYYLPFRQNYGPQAFLAVRSSGDAALLASSLRTGIQSIDRDVTLAQTGTMERALNSSVSQPRFDTVLLALFAGIALLLAAVGTYGLTAYSVAQRTHEIGVRMALGAVRADVVRMVVRQGAVLASIGIVLGLGGAAALTRLLRAMLFGVSSGDAWTFVAAPLGMTLVILLATFVPALQAARTSPVVTLRHE